MTPQVRSTTLAGVIAMGALLGVVPACTELSSIGKPVTTSSYRFVAADDAAMRLRNARCSREVACDGVGEGHRFANLDACLDDRGKDAMAHLATCTGGVGDVPLDTCLATVRAQPCGVLVDRLDSLMACRRGDICLRN